MIQTKKLSLAELKSNSANSRVIANIEAIKGGANEEYCHNGFGKQIILGPTTTPHPIDNTSTGTINPTGGW